VPSEQLSKIGTNINLGIVLGILVTYVFGLLLPLKTDVQAAMDDNLWRISYSLQLFPVVITTVMWLFWFRTEPVQFLIAKSEAQIGSSTYNECLGVIGRNHDAPTEAEQVEIFNKI